MKYRQFLFAALVLLGAAGGARAEVEGPAGEIETLRRLHQAVWAGRWGLVPLAVAGALLLALALSRRIAYRRRRLIAPKPLVEELHHVALGERPDREKLSRLAQSRSLLSDVVGSVLRTAGCTVLERSHLADNAIDTAFGKLKRGNGWFDVWYSVSTLVGLLGALYGLIEAFARQAEHPEAAAGAVVTSAVAPALTATAAGVLVAIAARFLGEYFKNLHGKRREEVEKLIHALVVFLQPDPPPPSPPGKGAPNGAPGRNGKAGPDPRRPGDAGVPGSGDGTPAPHF
jgi:biopolymer transport protein ExbB